MRRDAAIKHAVLRELKWDTRVEAAEVGVEVDHGVVTLIGTVSSYAKKLAAQAAAQRVAEVRDVVNDIQVNVSGRLARTDTDIAQMVRQVLTWDVLVPDERITTLVADGWVTIEGSVDVWAQREEAERAIQHLAGVRGVSNRLAVQAPQIAPQKVRQAIVEALERRAAHWVDHVEITVHNGTVTLAGQVLSWAEKQAILGAVGHTPGVAAVKDQLRIASAD